MASNGNITNIPEGRGLNTKDYAKVWLAQHDSSVEGRSFRVSKYYPEKDIWFLTLPVSYFDHGKEGDLDILLQNEHANNQFHYLKVPFAFFTDNQQKFDLRSSGERFDLHISAKIKNWLSCERSDGVNFREFACS